MFLPFWGPSPHTDPPIDNIILNVERTHVDPMRFLVSSNNAHIDLTTTTTTVDINLGFCNLTLTISVSPPCFNRWLHTEHLCTTTRSPHRLNTRPDSYIKLIHPALKTTFSPEPCLTQSCCWRYHLVFQHCCIKLFSTITVANAHGTNQRQTYPASL